MNTPDQQSSVEVHPEFVEGYMDGRNLDCPVPNENRSERYKHSFAIGRAEKLGKETPNYHMSMRNAYIADEKERTK